MPGNSFGQLFKITTFGESHGRAIGVVIDGCPAGLNVEQSEIQKQLDRRRPGQSEVTTSRDEPDVVEIISGIHEAVTLGSPICLIIKNKDQKSQDYDHLKNSYRPSHADYTYFKKYGLRDVRGGGRSSARETAARVAAGSIAKLLIAQEGIRVHAYVSQVGTVHINKDYSELDFDQIEDNMVRCPDPEAAQAMEQLILKTKEKGDTIGGRITCVIKNSLVGLGEPVFDRLEADLAKAMLSINASKGFEIGSGFSSVTMNGSDHNDLFKEENGKVITETNYSGGVQGGISNGMDIYFDVAFKPVSTIMMDQQSVDTSGDDVQIKGKGRHDPCVVPRAVPIVEAMTALVLADHLLRNRTSKV